MIVRVQDMAEVRGELPAFSGAVGLMIEMSIWSLFLVFIFGFMVGVVFMRFARP